jgi:Ser/Thr protein kinase RdoA (MazF antagonist)/NDP-sugar pyrophosphorylase family protein
MNEPVLVIMAAGMGSRFGGLKQITPVDEEGQIIMDFSLYDAWKAGFRKVVFIIKRALEADFKAAVGNRMEAYFDVRYAFQEVEMVPDGFAVPEGRTKPWGTGHAILSAKDVIDGPFAVLNADDYYGSAAMTTIYNYLKEEHQPNEHAMVGYLLRNTVTEHGSVARGVCHVENGCLRDIVERTTIVKRGNDAAYTEDGEHYTDLSGDTVVSMNLWGFQREFLEELEKRFPAFLSENLEKNPLKCEYFLPTVANAQLQEGKSTVRVLTTPDKWYGVTYAEDLPSVQQAVREMKAAGVYPKQLWMEPTAAYHFPLEGAPYSIERYGCGHINVTYLVVTTTGHRYILQKLSPAFAHPEELMENIVSVTRFLAEQADDPRETMTVVFTDEGKSFYTDETGHYRLYEFVEGTICLQSAESPEDFYQSAVGFGRFQKLLSAFPAETLHEAIPNFHNTIDRYRIFHETLEKDPMGRAKDVEKEISFVLAHEEEAGTLQRMRLSGELPLRVTHNDTKLNNVLLDEKTRKALCVIDLDTVMPGLSLYDFGDSIRFGAATAAEDEKDLSKMTIDLELFRIFTEGFLTSCDLTEREIELLPLGAKIMTLECGVRFLTDYLDGDHYFAVHREGHNLDRCRTQFKLVSEMERKWTEMADIVAQIANKKK